MAKFQDELNTALINFIADQKIFFTASAPSDGRINLSPKGIDTFRFLDNKTVAYLDLTGSGNETAAHISENGRLTVMFCSFSEKPLILRLYGTGEVIGRNHDNWDKKNLVVIHESCHDYVHMSNRGKIVEIHEPCQSEPYMSKTAR